MISNHFTNNQKFKENLISAAEDLKPVLYQYKKTPKYIIQCKQSGLDIAILNKKPAEHITEMPLGKGDSICFDFNDHYVGHLSFSLKSMGSPPDAPAHIRVKLGEHLCEITEDSCNYKGSLSSSWIQEEFIHVDILPAEIQMPRRYAFRYVEIKVLDTSPKYKVVIEQISCNHVTSADRSRIAPLQCGDLELQQIDAVSIKTMEDCMQDVFEDGPKRDRRLWLGDLRLQALTNYETFRNYDLVKRCLYLFAGLTLKEGQVGACLFTEPKPLIDDTVLFDYSLFFISCLYDYYQATGDMEVLKELWDIAYCQIEIAEREVDGRGVVIDKDTWWCFIDWQELLNKQAPAQAVFIYTLKQAMFLAEELCDRNRQNKIMDLLEQLIKGAKTYLWNEEKQFFVSGREQQISWASQIWFVLADILPKVENQNLLRRLNDVNPDIRMVTPYMNHHYVDALIQCEMMEQAKLHIKYYWGNMVKLGADCFWELFDPEDLYRSPYGSRVINSYCHAWSCTPSYIIRKYFTEDSF